jgi:methyl-accepting chemotaxis protein/nitric oxide dioxygenase
MTPKQIQLLRQSFSLVSASADKVAATFYNRLFELDPPLRFLFQSCLHEQGRKFMMMLRTVIGMLDHPDEFRNTLRSLGRRHAGYGVHDVDYETVGTALLWTLQRGLGWAFTPEVEEAWTALYHLISTTMREGVALGMSASSGSDCSHG